MKAIVINEKQRGLVFENGKFVKLITAGKYRFFRNKTVEILSEAVRIYTEKCSIEALLDNEEFKSSVDVYEIKDNELGLRFVNGKLIDTFKTGKYAFFKTKADTEMRIIDTSEAEITGINPVVIGLPVSTYVRYEVQPYEKGILYIDNKLTNVLDGGVYYFWRNGSTIKVECVDTRLIQLNIQGQEILTQDKVSLRINFICSYKLTDVVKSVSEIDDYEEQIRVIAQLALRDYVGKYKLDEILENKDAISKFVYDRLKEKENELYIKVQDAGVKDIILPGEIRNIMNTVLVAEKQAQANVITRREEVASTRSLLNTAKLMDENQTLYKLKELEYIERICENVGNISLNGGDGIIAQLSTILKGK
ncbi:MAG: slipin family protein [Clostridia bacterium]|nr:slipin family protein [Clostridia bacterium]